MKKQTLISFLLILAFVIVFNNAKSRNSEFKIGIIDSGINIEEIKNYNQLVTDGLLSIKKFSNDDSNNHGTLTFLSIYQSEILRNQIKKNNISFYIMDIGRDDDLSTSSLVEAIYDLVDEKVNIINISLGMYGNNEQLEAAVRYADENGILIVAAAGDDNTYKYVYPASYTSVISVSGTDTSGYPLIFNNINDEIDVHFIGENIQVEFNNGEKINVSGSSVATAKFTAYISYLMKKYNINNSRDIYSAIKGSTIIEYNNLLKQNIMKLNDKALDGNLSKSYPRR